ncbi:MAG: hypothetical protein LBT50_07790 [Prevotellaceae bacterium]|nr:hypothetical protein [Prevotellaceae bacterium]
MNYDELERTAAAIVAGIARLDRLSLEEESGRAKGGRRNVEASCLLIRDEKSDPGADEKVKRIRQETLLEEYARERGAWFDHEKESEREYLGDGAESFVYQDNNPGYVRKLVDPVSKTPLEFFDNRISLHNYLFPETFYELAGFTRTKGGVFTYIITQPYIKVTEYGQLDLADPQTVENYRRELEKRGFYLYDNDNTTIYNKDYIIFDLHKDNVLVNEKGDLFFIDTIPQLNTPESGFGGERKYGPGDVKPLISGFDGEELTDI